MFDNLRDDYARLQATFGPKTPIKRLLLTVTNYGFCAIVVFRFGKWANNISPRSLGIPFRLTYWILQRFVEMLFGISIDVNSTIGPGFFIGHFGCIVINGTIGRDCSVGQGVTIGSKGDGRSNGWPTLGDNVYLGAGAKIIGAINVGSNVTVGANAVVVCNVPNNSLAIGVPASIRPREPRA